MRGRAGRRSGPGAGAARSCSIDELLHLVRLGLRGQIHVEVTLYRRRRFWFDERRAMETRDAVVTLVARRRRYHLDGRAIGDPRPWRWRRCPCARRATASTTWRSERPPRGGHGQEPGPDGHLAGARQRRAGARSPRAWAAVWSPTSPPIWRARPRPTVPCASDLVHAQLGQRLVQADRALGPGAVRQPLATAEQQIVVGAPAQEIAAGGRTGIGDLGPVSTTTHSPSQSRPSLQLLAGVARLAQAGVHFAEAVDAPVAVALLALGLGLGPGPRAGRRRGPRRVTVAADPTSETTRTRRSMAHDDGHYHVEDRRPGARMCLTRAFVAGWARRPHESAGTL